MLSLHYILHVSCPILVNKENHTKALWFLVYILDTRVLIYYQYLYGAIDVDGPWWYGHM